ncbi:MAG: hypothetical protein QW220_00655 [Candidatus Bathyarchaeia archaeon]
MVRIFGRKKEESGEKDRASTAGHPSFSLKPQISVSEGEADKAKKELRLLEIEKDIAQYALMKIYEAEAGGLMSVTERDSLAERYKAQMKSVEERIHRNQMLITLRELEVGQSELVKMFNEKFAELENRIQEIRNRLGYAAPLSQSPSPTPTPSTATKAQPSSKEIPKAEQRETRPSRRSRERGEGGEGEGEPATGPPKTEAEMEIERLRSEIQKALEKLEQIELEI